MAPVLPDLKMQEDLYKNKSEEEIIELLGKNTWEGKWDRVVEIYNIFPWTHMEKINDSSQDTALHAAADSGKEDTVDELVNIILIHETKTEERGESSHRQQQQQQQDEYEIFVGEKFQEKLDKRAKVKALEIKNENGDTPLHLAASKGFVGICRSIVGIMMERSEIYNFRVGGTIGREYLQTIRNKEGETPIFLAALNCQTEAFIFLLTISLGVFGGPELARNNGDTILHCAIQREYFELAAIILHYYGYWLTGRMNNKEITPLKMLATKPSAFWSSSNLTWWEKILYSCFPVEQPNVESMFSANRGPPLFEASPPKIWGTCCNNVKSLLLRIGRSIGFRKENEGDVEGEPGAAPPVYGDIEDEFGAAPPVYRPWRTCLEIVTLVFVFLTGLSRIKIQKEKHLWAAIILDELMEDPSKSYRGQPKDPTFPAEIPKLSGKDGKTTSTTYPTNSKAPETENQEAAMSTEKQDKSSDAIKIRKIEIEDTTPQSEKTETGFLTDKKETPLLVAARYGICEMVNEILKKLPITVQEKNSETKNVLLVAVQNRQSLIVKALKRHSKESDNEQHWDNLIVGVDKNENTVLHLAAEIKDQKKPWKIPGVFMQMTWEVKWYEYIKNIVPAHFHLRSNKDDKTPGETFNESHNELVSQGSEWLKDTSESCSVVAALIAGVSFATSSTVPGDYDSTTGKPALEGQPAFSLFAMTSLVSLCFSVTALIMFLSILTSRKQAKDFRRDLPLKLLLGLSSFFVSIASMFISFCAGHFFVVRDKYKNALFPIYVATCIPVTLYAVYQFPLYFDLLTAIFDDVPHQRYKGDDS